MDSQQLQQLIDTVVEKSSSEFAFRVCAQKLFTEFATMLGLHSGEFFLDWGTMGTPPGSVQLRTLHLLARAVPGRPTFVWWPTSTFFVFDRSRLLTTPSLLSVGKGVGPIVYESWNSIRAAKDTVERVLKTVEQFITSTN